MIKMSDYTVVYFSGIDRGFSVPAVLADFNIFGIDVEIRFYGAIIAFGFLLAVLFGGRMAYKWKMSLDKMIDVLIYGTIFAIIGARLYYVFSKWDYYGAHLAEIPQIWQGGLAIYGGVIGAFVIGALMCYIRKVNILDMFDVAAIGFLIGQGIGRWGNFINQEAYGTPTGSTWFGISGERIVSDSGIAESLSLMHPCFLYESIWCLLGFLILHKLSKKRAFAGETACMYVAWYGFGRMIIEGFRTDSLMLGQVRVSQLVSGLMFIAGILLIVVLRRAVKINKATPVYQQQFDAVDEAEIVEDTDIEQTANVSAKEDVEDGTDNQR